MKPYGMKPRDMNCIPNSDGRGWPAGVLEDRAAVRDYKQKSSGARARARAANRRLVAAELAELS